MLSHLTPLLLCTLLNEKKTYLDYFRVKVFFALSPFSIFGLAVKVVRPNRTAFRELVVLPLFRAAPASGSRRG